MVQTIFPLAQGCPAIDGSVVYAARNLYNRVTTSAINFIDACPKNNSRKAKKVLYVDNKGKALEKKADIAERSFTVYPNPSNGNLNIQLPQNGHWQITVTDQLGRISWNQSVTNKGNVINHQLNGSKGLLLVKATNLETGKELVQKVLYILNRKWFANYTSP